jgi:hypothetical protein
MAASRPDWPGPGLGHVVGSAAGQRLDGDLGAALGERTAHDHRHSVSPRATPQRHQTIHHRHLHIQQNQVGAQRLLIALRADSPSTAVPATSRRVGADHRAQQAPHHRRVVHDQNPGSATRRHLSGLHQPSMASFSLSASLVEGLHQVFVGAGIQSAKNEIVLRLGGHHHDLHVAESSARSR